KRLAEEFRALDPVAPRQLDRLGDTDADADLDVRFFRARKQRDRRLVERPLAVCDADAECLAGLARPRAQVARIVQAPAPSDWREAMGRLQRADQHGAG